MFRQEFYPIRKERLNSIEQNIYTYQTILIYLSIGRYIPFIRNLYTFCHRGLGHLSDRLLTQAASIAKPSSER